MYLREEADWYKHRYNFIRVKLYIYIGTERHIIIETLRAGGGAAHRAVAATRR